MIKSFVVAMLLSCFYADNTVKTVTYDEAIKVSKQERKQVVVFVGIEPFEFAGQKDSIVVKVNTNKADAVWLKYEGKIVVGQWKSSYVNEPEFVVVNVIDAKTADSTFLMPKHIVQQMPVQYKDCPSCQQMYWNKFKK